MSEFPTELEVLSQTIRCVDRNDEELFEMDVIEAKLRLEDLEQVCKTRSEIIEKYRDWLNQKFPGKNLSVTQVWSFLGVVVRMSVELKKKQDDIQMLLGFSESTPSNLATENSGVSRTTSGE